MVRSLRSPFPLAVLLFVLCVWLYTRNNTFPFFYHPDEPGKVSQILTCKWNFHHPLLMLASVKLAAAKLPATSREQNIVVVGRWISAVFAALGVVIFAWLGFLRRGWPGFIAVGVTLGLHHQVFELAHYMKEDTSLFMGMSLSFLAMALFWKNKNAASLVFIGIACGLSVSAKYLGVVVLVPAIIVILRAPKQKTKCENPTRFTIFLVVFVITFAAINYPLFTNFQMFVSSFHREVTLVREGSGQIPFFEYLKIFVSNSNLAIWFFLCVFFARQWRMRRERDTLDWTFTIFPFVFVALLSCSHKTNDRYFLPATAMFCFLAGLGICDAVALLPAARRNVSGAIALGCVAFFQIVQVPLLNPHSLSDYYTAFRHDDHADLVAWIQTNAPRDAVIAEDARADLSPRAESGQSPLTQKIVGKKMLADLGTLDEFIAKNVTYAVASESDYGKFFRKAWASRNPREIEKKKFYDDLFRRGELLWERPRGTVIYLHPGLRVYRLPTTKQSFNFGGLIWNDAHNDALQIPAAPTRF